MTEQEICARGLVTGEKKGDKKPKPPYKAPISAKSTSIAKLLIALSEGQVEASSGGVISPKDIFLDNVPITNQDGSDNYSVRWEFRKGTQDQPHINSLPSVENYFGVGQTLKQNTPYVYSITNTEVDQVRVNLSFPALQRATDQGDYYATSVSYAIDIATTAGSWVEQQVFTLSARFISEYQRSHEFDLPESDDGWRVRVRRLTADSEDMYLQNDMVVAGVTEIIDTKLRYPNTSLLYLEFDAEMFSSLPKVSVRMKGKVVRVPDNYDPVSRTYGAVWSGMFKWAYTNNPVWCLLDVLLSKTHGLGERLSLAEIDKWGFYQIARWCDVQVPDGKGGMECRHSLNVYIQKQVDAWRLLQDICSNFNGNLFWNGEQVELYADIPSDVVFTYNRSNVVNGEFTDAGVNVKTKFTQALISWDNPDNKFNTDKTQVYDIDLTRRFGVRHKDIPAFGVTSEGEAQRKGLWALTANMFDRYRTFKVGLDGFIPKVGELVSVADNRFAGAAISGRIKSVSSKNNVELDRECRVAVGDRLTINLPSGISQTRTVRKVNGNSITVTMDYSERPKSGLAFNIDSDDLSSLTMRILKVDSNDDKTFSIKAVEYNASKQDYIDNGASIELPPTSITPIGNITPPTNLKIFAYSTVEQGISVTHLVFSWDRVKDAVSYEVQWNKDGSDWINMPRAANSQVEISGVYEGVYSFRVRSVDAMEFTSVYQQSESKFIEGKIGAAKPLAFLRTKSEVMGIRLDWGFQPNSGDSNKTVIMVNTIPSDDGATLLGEFSYPTDTYTHRGLAHDVRLFFKGRVQDKIGGFSSWTEWVDGSSSADSSEILSYLDGQIENSHLGGILKGEIDKIKEIDDLQIKINEIESLVQDLEAIPFFDPTATYLAGNMVKFDNVIYAAKQDVPAGIAPPNSMYWDNIGGFESLNDIVSALVSEVRVNTTKIEQQGGQITSIGNQQNIINNKVTDHENRITGQSTSISTLETKVQQTSTGLQATSNKVDSIYSSIKPEMAGATDINSGTNLSQAGVWSVWSSIVETDLAMAQRVDTVLSQVNANKADIQIESTTRATQVDAVARQVTTLQAKVDTDISAAIQDIEETIATENEALTRQIKTAQTGVNSNKSAIQSEATTRADADSALSTKIDTLQTKVGDDISAAIESEATTRSNADSALGSRIDTTQATVNNVSASVQQVQQAQVDLAGKVNTSWAVKLLVNNRGEYVTAGVGLGIDNDSGTLQSNFIVQADRFVVQQGLNGSGQTVFAVDKGQTIIKSALIGDATITMAKIGGDLFSTNYIAGRSGWRLSKNGNFEINSTIANEGRIEINNRGMRVYDATGRLRVKIGDLR